MVKFLLVGLGTIGVATSLIVAARPPTSDRASKSAESKVGSDPGYIKEGGALHPKNGDQLACFSGGCFWGVENFFRKTPGVVATAVGYTGGNVPNPTYELVCSHTTGYAESVLVEYDPSKISYRTLVDDFWKVHDPTTVDRQGPDVGSNYRSAIWTFDDKQLKDAMASVKARQAKESRPIVTQVKPAVRFYLAEDYHQQYDEKTGTESCPIRE